MKRVFIASFVLLFSFRCWGKTKPVIRPVKQKDLAMTCHFDQWRRLTDGTIQYTHMMCEDQRGGMSPWMRVPDHSITERRETLDAKERVEKPLIATPLPPVQLPEVKPSPPPDDDDDSATKAPRL